eukprot:SAG31_NODE_18256_length_642_cov_0.856354_1_plen_77_part_00
MRPARKARMSTSSGAAGAVVTMAEGTAVSVVSVVILRPARKARVATSSGALRHPPNSKQGHQNHQKPYGGRCPKFE